MHNIKGILNTEQIKKRNLSNFQEGPKKKKKQLQSQELPSRQSRPSFHVSISMSQFLIVYRDLLVD